MTQTFDIRFERSAGLAALLEPPGNAFRWKGRGVLSVDAGGINVGPVRWLPWLRRGRRITADDIKAVYREGEALRVEFAGPEDKPAVLPFWAENGETASRIVDLLPTKRTVELDSGRSSNPIRQSHQWRRAAVIFGVPLLAIGATLVFIFRGSATTPSVAPQVVDITPRVGKPETVVPLRNPEAVSASPAAPVNAEEAGVLFPSKIVAATMDETTTDNSMSVVVAPRYRELARPIDPSLPAHKYASSLFVEFERDADSLAAAFMADQRLWIMQAITREEFIARLEAHESRWWEITFEILSDRKFQQDPALADFRRTLLVAGRLSRLHLTLFAQGARYQDLGLITLANDAMVRADEMRALARRFLR